MSYFISKKEVEENIKAYLFLLESQLKEMPLTGDESKFYVAYRQFMIAQAYNSITTELLRSLKELDDNKIDQSENGFDIMKGFLDDHAGYLINTLNMPTNLIVKVNTGEFYQDMQKDDIDKYFPESDDDGIKYTPAQIRLSMEMYIALNSNAVPSLIEDCDTELKEKIENLIIVVSNTIENGKILTEEQISELMTDDVQAFYDNLLEVNGQMSMNEEIVYNNPVIPKSQYELKPHSSIITDYVDEVNKSFDKIYNENVKNVNIKIEGEKKKFVYNANFEKPKVAKELLDKYTKLVKTHNERNVSIERYFDVEDYQKEEELVNDIKNKLLKHYSPEMVELAGKKEITEKEIIAMTPVPPTFFTKYQSATLMQGLEAPTFEEYIKRYLLEEDKNIIGLDEYGDKNFAKNKKYVFNFKKNIDLKSTIDDIANKIFLGAYRFKDISIPSAFRNMQDYNYKMVEEDYRKNQKYPSNTIAQNYSQYSLLKETFSFSQNIESMQNFIKDLIAERFMALLKDAGVPESDIKNMDMEKFYTEHTIGSKNLEEHKINLIDDKFILGDDEESEKNIINGFEKYLIEKEFDDKELFAEEPQKEEFEVQAVDFGDEFEEKDEQMLENLNDQHPELIEKDKQSEFANDKDKEVGVYDIADFEIDNMVAVLESAQHSKDGFNFIYEKGINLLNTTFGITASKERRSKALQNILEFTKKNETKPDSITDFEKFKFCVEMGTYLGATPNRDNVGKAFVLYKAAQDIYNKRSPLSKLWGYITGSSKQERNLIETCEARLITVTGLKAESIRETIKSTDRINGVLNILEKNGKFCEEPDRVLNFLNKHPNVKSAFCNEKFAYENKRIGTLISEALRNRKLPDPLTNDEISIDFSNRRWESMQITEREEILIESIDKKFEETYNSPLKEEVDSLKNEKEEVDKEIKSKANSYNKALGVVKKMEKDIANEQDERAKGMKKNSFIFSKEQRTVDEYDRLLYNSKKLDTRIKEKTQNLEIEKQSEREKYRNRMMETRREKLKLPTVTILDEIPVETPDSIEKNELLWKDYNNELKADNAIIIKNYEAQYELMQKLKGSFGEIESNNDGNVIGENNMQNNKQLDEIESEFSLK